MKYIYLKFFLKNQEKKATKFEKISLTLIGRIVIVFPIVVNAAVNAVLTRLIQPIATRIGNCWQRERIARLVQRVPVDFRRQVVYFAKVHTTLCRLGVSVNKATCYVISLLFLGIRVVVCGDSNDVYLIVDIIFGIQFLIQLSQLHTI